MSFVRLNIKSRIELETRVLAAALKLSFERGDSDGAGLAHKQLFYLLKDVGKSEPGNIQSIRISDGVPPGLFETEEPASARINQTLPTPTLFSSEPVSEGASSEPSESGVSTNGADPAVAENPEEQVAQTPNAAAPEGIELDQFDEADEELAQADDQPMSLAVEPEWQSPSAPIQEMTAFRPGFMRHSNRPQSVSRPTEHATAVMNNSEVTVNAGQNVAETPEIAARVSSDSVEFAQPENVAESQSVAETDRAVGEESNRSAVDDVQPGEAGAGSSDSAGVGSESVAAGQCNDDSARQAEARSGNDEEFDQENGRSGVEVAEKTDIGEENSDEEDESDDHGEGKSDREKASETPRVAQSDDAAPSFQKSPNSETEPAGDRSDTGELSEYARKAREPQIKSEGIGELKTVAAERNRQADTGDMQIPADEFENSESPELQSTSSDGTPYATEAAGSREDGESDPSVSADNVAPASDVALDAEVSITAAGATTAFSDDASCAGDALPAFDENSGTKTGSFEETDRSEPSTQSFAPPPQSEPAPEASVMGATLEFLIRRPADPNSTGEMAALPVPAAKADVPAASKALAPATESKATGAGIYAMLSVSQMSSFDEIHTQFLRKARAILQAIKQNRAIRYDKLPELQKLWIAHDILSDPVTRTDYDFRNLGVRGAPESIALPPDDQQPQRLGSRTPLRIGELLQCAGLLETTELEIACDMHKAMPEMQFGTFLVKQGFIEEHHLDAVLVGQKLLRAGAISVAQFKSAMDTSQGERIEISKVLIDKGYLTESELDLALNPPPPDEAPPLNIQIKEIALTKSREPNTVELKASEMKPAMPAWKDQLDWGPPDDTPSSQTEAPKPSLGGLLSGRSAALSRAPVVSASVNPATVSDSSTPSEPANSPNVLDTSSVTPAPAGPSGPIVANAAMAASSAVTPSAPIFDNQRAVPSWKDQLDWGSSANEDTKDQGLKSEFAPDAVTSQESAQSGSRTESSVVSAEPKSAQQEQTSSQPPAQSISSSANVVPTTAIAVEPLANQPTVEAEMPVSASDSAPPAERTTNSDSLPATAERAELAALPDSSTKADTAKSPRETSSDLPVSTHDPRTRLTFSSAVPTWKDQLDWGAPEDSNSAAEPSASESKTLQSASSTFEDLPSLVSSEQPSSSALIPADDSILSYGKMAQAFEDDDEPFLLPPTALPNMAGPAAVNSMLQAAIPDAQSGSEQSESSGSEPPSDNLFSNLARQFDDKAESAVKEASLASSSHSEAKEIGDREESHGADVESADAFSLSDQQASASSEPAVSDEPDPEATAETVSEESGEDGSAQRQARKDKKKKAPKDKRKKRR